MPKGHTNPQKTRPKTIVRTIVPAAQSEVGVESARGQQRADRDERVELEKRIDRPAANCHHLVPSVETTQNQ